MARKKKFKKVTTFGVKHYVECKKDHNRPPVAPPSIVHKSKKDYNRQESKLALKKMRADF